MKLPEDFDFRPARKLVNCSSVSLWINVKTNRFMQLLALVLDGRRFSVLLKNIFRLIKVKFCRLAC